MSVYLDASVLVALLTHDPLTGRAESLLRRRMPELIVSDFAAAEFASALARRVRMRALDVEEAQAGFAAFDAWTARATRRVQISASDIAAAAAFLRRLDLALRTPDAIHVAIAQRVGASLATFDRKMALAAETIGSSVLTD